MRFLSVTTWSLNRLLGSLQWNEWDDAHKKIVTRVEEKPEVHSLLELPQLLVEKGYEAMEVIHPHFPSTELSYLEELRQAVEKAGIRFYTLLIDYGDISSEDPLRQAADVQFLKEWIDVAAAVGAEHVRIIGGEAEPDAKKQLQTASEQLNEICSYAQTKGVGVLTENFKRLTSTAENCLYLNEQTAIAGLITDFGNFSGESKLHSIQETLPHSKSIHVKALQLDDGSIDQAELEQCLELVVQGDYSGPLTIVYDGPDDMWSGIKDVEEIAKYYL
ncbi:sugar phosphate isomerase/epimerase [Alkalihalobacillus xiaoxiensis]|uniref:Sugar phosphate isomerase/epimerase n=1 Tax=Shouchella xiaoxiensis TaxID=766895 RepID=A0ABS2T2K1_9BACI|nr:sugar phosphate isomerase/epimerase [Shouchella xiaoxiensis]